jgi:hypothetical protein
MIPRRKVSLIVDSGAFSAWVHKESIDVRSYIYLIKRIQKKIVGYFNLDVIGDPEKTYANQLAMEAEGLKPIPVYHAGSDITWLKKYADAHDYIAIGALAKTSTEKRHRQLNRIFREISDEQGLPSVKLHGFAISSIATMIEYPWYSVDSTSWVMASRFGKIFLPPWKNDAWDYTKAPHHIIVSTTNPKQSKFGEHINTITGLLREQFFQYIKERGAPFGKSTFIDEGGKKVEIIEEPGVSNYFVWRDRVNIAYFKDLEKTIPPWPWAFKPRSTPNFGVRLK